MSLKAAFFDMDGVLYDSMPNHAASWTAVFNTVGIDYPATASYENEGRTSKGTIQLAYRTGLGRDATNEEITLLQALKTHMMNLRPTPSIMEGMPQLIERLQKKGIQTLIVTGSKQPSLLNRLAHDFGIDAANVVSGNDVTREKPDPQPYLIALQRANVLPEEAIVIENAPLGIQSAKSAGIHTIAVNTGILHDDVLLKSGADILISHTLDLQQRWDEIVKMIGK